MNIVLEKFNKEQLKKLPDIKPGDTLRVHQKVKEGNKERIQIFEGIVIAKKHGNGINATITVRKMIDGVGVERVFPIHTPSVEKMEVVKRGKVRRAKLYYLRTAKGKKAKPKRKDFEAAIAPEEQKEIVEPTSETPAPENAAEEVK